MSAPLSPLLRDLDGWKSCQYHINDARRGLVPLVTVEFHEAWMAEMRLRWERDKAFARRICKERGFDIDELAKSAPEYHP